MACHACFTVQEFGRYQILAHICFYQGDNWFNSIGRFLSTSNVSGLPFFGTHFDAGKPGRLNIVCFSRLACSLRHCRPSLGQVSEPSPLCLSPEVLLRTDAQTEAIDVWSAGMTLMELLTGCTTLRVDDQTGLSHVAPVPALEFRTLRWLKVCTAEMISGVRFGSNQDTLGPS